MTFTIETLAERNPHRGRDEIEHLTRLSPMMLDRIRLLRERDLFGEWTNETDRTCAIYIVADDLARERDLAKRLPA
jgi:hypothetical protein